MKFLLAFCLIAALGAVTFAYNAVWDIQTSMLYSENLYRNAIPNCYLNVSVVYPAEGTDCSNIITSVLAYDEFKNSSGAKPELLRGGPGYTYVELRMQSQVGQGINMTINVSGIQLLNGSNCSKGFM